MCGGGGSSDPEIKDTEDQKVLARIASEQYARNRKLYDGVEEQFFNYSDSFQSPTKRQEAGQMASAATTAAYGEQFKQIAKSLAASGINPSSGAFQSAMWENANEQGAAGTNNTNRTLQALDDTGLQAQSNVVAIGNKRAGSALAGMSDMASLSSYEAENKARQSVSNGQANEYMAGTVAGAGYSAYQNA